MKDLTDRQGRILEYIRQCLQETGMAPTMREIAGECGLSNRCTVFQHLKALERKGFIRRAPRRHRGIQIEGSDLPTYAELAAEVKRLRAELARARTEGA